jgi:hypothetical protein
MKKVTAHFHTNETVTQESAILFNGNILMASDYDFLYFRVVKVGYLNGNDYHVREYGTVELPYKVSAELIEEMSFLDYIALAAK